MSDIQAQFSVLKQTAEPAVADAIARLIEKGEDRELNRINVLDSRGERVFDEERVISGFLHASRLGLFELTGNVLRSSLQRSARCAFDAEVVLRHDDQNCAVRGGL